MEINIMERTIDQLIPTFKEYVNTYTGVVDDFFESQILCAKVYEIEIDEYSAAEYSREWITRLLPIEIEIYSTQTDNFFGELNVNDLEGRDNFYYKVQDPKKESKPLGYGIISKNKIKEGYASCGMVPFYSILAKKRKYYRKKDNELKSDHKNKYKINSIKNLVLAISCISCNTVGSMNCNSTSFVTGAISNDKRLYN